MSHHLAPPRSGLPAYQPAARHRGIPPWTWVLAVGVGLPIVVALASAGSRRLTSRNASTAGITSTPTPPESRPVTNAQGALTASPPAPARSGPATSEGPLAWIATVRSNCSRYENAPNDIVRSAIFRENNALLRETTVSGARGKLTLIYTNQGGSDLKLTIKSGTVEFTTESLFSPIPRGSPVYDAAADMREGECVVFSATNLAPASFLEHAQVCELDYFAVFTSLAPCR